MLVTIYQYTYPRELFSNGNKKRATTIDVSSQLLPTHHEAPKHDHRHCYKPTDDTVTEVVPCDNGGFTKSENVQKSKHG